MSVMGSQLEIDLDPEGSETIVPRHTGQTGTGCFHLHDHSILETLEAGDRQGPLFVSHLSTAAAMDAEGRVHAHDDTLQGDSAGLGSGLG